MHAISCNGGRRPVINLKSLNKFVHTEHFKMEGIHVLRDLLRSGDWMAKVDLKDVYFMLPIREVHRAFLRFSFKDRTYIPVQVPTVWPCKRPMGLHQDPEANRGTAETTGRVNDRLHRRHTHLGRVQGASSGPCDRPGVPAGKPGFCSKQSQVPVGTDTNHRVSRFFGRLAHEELSLPSGKVKKIRAETLSLLEGRQVSIRKLSQLLGKLQAATRVQFLWRHFFSAKFSVH